jgi:pyridoxal phosphate enzyme (YggS family)
MHGTRDEVLANLATIRGTIADACERAGRAPDTVTLVGAAKTVPSEVVGWVARAGVDAIGHNYVQELRAMHDRVPGVRWHFIGTLQASSAHHVAALADVVETAAGEKATTRLARRAREAGRVVDVLIEVDLTGERSGVAPDALPAFADLVADLEGLRLRGLMTLPPIPERAKDARPWFARLRELRDALARTHPQVVDLSMGMSLDYAVAVEEGATMVRIGTALFGPRTT